MSDTRKTSREACIAALRRAADELGHSPSLHEYDDHGLTPGSSTIQRVFGSWNAAKRAAGLATDERHERQYSSADLLAAIRDVHRRSDQNRLPRAEYDRRRGDDDPCGDTIYLRLGSYSEARERALREGDDT